MKAGKEFDCVEMKAEIQERLLREVPELGEEEAQRRRAERLSRDPILRSFLRRENADRLSTAEESEVFRGADPYPTRRLWSFEEGSAGTVVACWRACVRSRS